MALHSISSQIMTPMLTWRNPDGKEENWVLPFSVHQPHSACALAGRIIVTEIGLGFLAITSTVETAAYSL